MKIGLKPTDEPTIEVSRYGIIIQDNAGNSWRVGSSDDGRGLSVMLRETANDSLTGLVVKPLSGNVVEVLPEVRP